MAGEVESRLRASLQAYARLADDGAARQATGSLSLRRRSRAVRWAPVLVAASVLVVLGAVWLVVGSGRSARTGTAASGTAAVATTSSSAAPASGNSVAGTVAGPDTGTVAATVPGAPGHPGTPTLPPFPAVGVVYRFDLLTHCGVRGTDVGGVWFAARPVLAKEGFSAPEGWGNPYQPGTLTLTSASTAVFRDDLGHVVSLVAAPRESPPPCD